MEPSEPNSAIYHVIDICSGSDTRLGIQYLNASVWVCKRGRGLLNHPESTGGRVQTTVDRRKMISSRLQKLRTMIATLLGLCQRLNELQLSLLLNQYISRSTSINFPLLPLQLPPVQGVHEMIIPRLSDRNYPLVSTPPGPKVWRLPSSNWTVDRWIRGDYPPLPTSLSQIL